MTQPGIFTSFNRETSRDRTAGEEVSITADDCTGRVAAIAGGRELLAHPVPATP